jgi:hypothetical protein
LIVDKLGKNIIRADLMAVPGVNSFIDIHDRAGNKLKHANEVKEGQPESINDFGAIERTYYVFISSQGQKIIRWSAISATLLWLTLCHKVSNLIWTSAESHPMHRGIFREVHRLSFPKK